MKSLFYLLFVALISTSLWAQNNNRGRARPNYNPENLTDAERKESESFIHEGKTQRVMMEQCAGLTEEESKLFQTDPSKAYEQFGDKLSSGMELCEGKAQVKGAGLSPEMAGAITKAYAMIIGLGGEAFGKMKMKSLKEVAAEKPTQTDTPSSTNTTPNTTTQTDTPSATDTPQNTTTQTDTPQDNTKTGDAAKDEKEKDNTDYCKWVAVGTEAIAMVQQTMAQQEIQSVPLAEEASAQRAALLRVKRGYEERQKNARTQAWGWGITTGCYTAMMATAAFNVTGYATNIKDGWSNYLKLGAAGFLTVVFGTHASKFKDAAEKTGLIADMLPGKGDCNPHTDRDCYCSQPTTMNHPQYCAPYLHQNTIRDPGITMRTSCINDQAEADPKCACMQTNSCLHNGMDTVFTMDGFAAQVNPTYLSDLKSLSTGTVPSSLNASANSRNSNAARTAMKKADEELSKLQPPNPNLTEKQTQEAKFLEAQGVPPTLARAMASTPLEGDAKEIMAAVQSRFGNAAASAPAGSTSFNASLKDRAQSNGLRPKKAAKKEDKSNPFAKYLNQGKGTKQQPTGNILNLAQKAEANAQISNRKESSVFDIISHRYKTSAWRRLELEDL